MGMALRSLLHSTCYLLGNTNEHDAYGHGGVKAIPKVSNEERISSKVRGGDGICSSGFQMPLHYPRFKKTDYENMEEWKLDLLLKEYGLSFEGSLSEKRVFAMGAFLWPDQD